MTNQNSTEQAGEPIAGEAQPVAWRFRRNSEKKAEWMAGRDPASAEWYYRVHSPKTTELREGAFQLSPSPDHVDWEPLYVAPQASEVDVIEEIAKQWDGCIYDAGPGGDIDIGQAIRGAANKRS